MILNFFVPGIPQAQAGTRDVIAGGNVHRQITTGSIGLQPWRDSVTQIAGLTKNLTHWERATGPVAVHCTFMFAIPKSRRSAELIQLHAVKPDIDKLQRAIHDSLTGAGIYLDDAQVAFGSQAKYEVADDRLAGVEVLVWPAELGISPELAAAIGLTGTVDLAGALERRQWLASNTSVVLHERKRTHPR